MEQLNRRVASFFQSSFNEVQGLIYIYIYFLIKKMLTESIKGTIFQKDSTIVKISKDFVSPLYGSFALSAHLFRCIM